jgi:methionyl aminopeptidase
MIIIHSEEELKLIRASSRIVAEVLKELTKLIKPGVTTAELDKIAEEMTRERGGNPAFKGYKGFPAAICASINEEIVHGIPGSRILKEGDIIGVDMGVEYKGYFGDSAVTVAVGEISSDIQKLLRVTREALFKGIKKARAGNRLSDISHAIQSHVEKNGFSVVREFVGHGIGSSLHEEPQIPNLGKPKQGPRLKPGMVLAIEPMVNMGTFEVEVKEDNWTAVTRDGQPSAHFEHTIIITNEDPEIVTM